MTLDDDVATKLRQLAHRHRMSFRKVVNAVLRRGLAAQQRGVESPQPFRGEPFRSAFRAGVDPMRLNQLNVGGNLTTDTHLAALAIEHQCELHSNDADFGRFPRLRWQNSVVIP